jgi:hypothetical protein
MRSSACSRGYDRLLEPAEIKAAPEPNTFGPNALFRWADEYEPRRERRIRGRRDGSASSAPRDPRARSRRSLVDLDCRRRRDRQSRSTSGRIRLALAQGWLPGASREEAEAARRALLRRVPSLADAPSARTAPARRVLVPEAESPVSACSSSAATTSTQHGRSFVGRTALDRTLARRLGTAFVEYPPPDA